MNFLVTRPLLEKEKKNPQNAKIFKKKKERKKKNYKSRTTKREDGEYTQ